jgi:guanosine-3',5'-bis(diphosphate) 3'-pyrophosphohydrolase
MRAKRKSFSEIMDIYAFRIVVDSVDSCYRVLGCIHSLYKPVPGEFKDYIAIPKANGYQSLHTVTMGMHGVPIEIQIRTHEMEDMANNGIAAHWLYKTDSGSANGSHARARQWVQGLLEMQQRAGNSLEFIENVKIDLFPDEIYVFTPKGHIMELPRGATAVDFAYAVHTELGNSCVACRINRRLAPLSEPLQSGQTVEVITAAGARPNPSWFNYAVTAKARSNIRHFLKQQTREDAIALGRRLLDKSLRPMGLSVAELAPRRLASYLDSAGLAALDDLLAELAQGRRLPGVVAAQLAGELDKEGPLPEPASDSPLAIRGTEGFMVSYARCCRPLPGDAIAGYLSSERGVIVHRESCRNLAEHARQARAVDRPALGRRGQRRVHRRAAHRGRKPARYNRHDSDTHQQHGREHREDQHHGQGPPVHHYVDLELLVRSRVHLAHIMRRLRSVDRVRKVTRVSN